MLPLSIRVICSPLARRQFFGPVEQPRDLRLRIKALISGPERFGARCKSLVG
jgi:hypothetical protein